jgi:hypothetical protein
MRNNTPSSVFKSVLNLLGRLGVTCIKVGFISAYGAGLNALGAFVLSRSGHSGYDVAEAAGLSAAGTGIFTLVILTGNSLFCSRRESKQLTLNSSEEQTSNETEVNKVSVATGSCVFFGTFTGWTLFHFTNIGSMEIKQAVLSTLMGGAVTAPIICSVSCSLLGTLLFKEAKNTSPENSLPINTSYTLQPQ